jgi:hypothetical protein
MSTVTLINLNRIAVPLVAPYALDVLGSAVAAGGHDVDVVDLNLEADPLAAIAGRFRREIPDVVAITLRNTGDLYFPSFLDLDSRGSCLPDHEALVGAIKAWVPADRIVIGGVGFSSNAVPLLSRLGLARGVVGPGEGVLRRIADAASRRPTIGVLPDLVRLPSDPSMIIFDGTRLPLATSVRRGFVDSKRYYDEGGLAGVRTNNGCAMRCSYCVEPFAKGGAYLRQAVDGVTAEIDQLLEAGIYDIHTCDSEFNMPIEHTKRVLRAIVDRRYPSALRFWAYCQPRPFDAELAALLAQANFTGVSFGIDHTDPHVLRLLGKTWYTLDHIRDATRLCHAHGIAVNHELLFGYPGDTPDRMFAAIDAVAELRARAMGVVVGLAVLAGTRLGDVYAQKRARSEPLDGFYSAGEPLVDPTFYVDPSFAIPDVFARLRAHLGSEIRRVMMPQVNSTAAETNQLVGSIRVQQDLRNGKRGAYWYHYQARMQEVVASRAPASAFPLDQRDPVPWAVAAS